MQRLHWIFNKEKRGESILSYHEPRPKSWSLTYLSRETEAAFNGLVKVIKPRSGLLVEEIQRKILLCGKYLSHFHKVLNLDLGSMSHRPMRAKPSAVANLDHCDADCFGCAILSHGREGSIYATDAILPLEAVTMPFRGERCPSLVGKPKLFFLQACRATKLDHGVDVLDSTSERSEDDMIDSGSLRKIPIEADFLFAYSTVPGNYSWRNNQEGSWFIQALCIVLENYGVKMELLHMLTQVNRIVAYEFEACTDEEFTDKSKHMPCFVSMLTRYVYFRPKKPDIRG